VKKFVHFLKLAVTVIAAGTLTGLLVMAYALRDSGDIETPYVEGEEIITALEKVSAVGLNLKMSGLAFHDELPRNYIVSQDPKPGSGLKAGRDVRVVVSKGVRDVVMPDVREMTLHQAESILKRRGFRLSSADYAHSAIKEGYVIAQLPPRGRRIGKEVDVELLVSRGPWPRRFILADFRGEDAFEITGVIQRAGLRLGKLRYSGDSGAPEGVPSGAPGSIISQEPLPGKPVVKGDEISLTIRSGDTDSKNRRSHTLYNYTLPSKRGGIVKVVSDNIDGEKDIYIRSHKGGQTISILVEVAGATSVRIYIDGDLAEVKQFEPM
jgi:serine/threonine-protein kinase